MDNTLNNKIAISQILDGIEIAESDQQQLETLALISQIKSSVELIIGISPQRKLFVKELMSLITNHVSQLNESEQQRYQTAISRQMIEFCSIVIKQLSSELKPDEFKIIQKNLDSLQKQTSN